MSVPQKRHCYLCGDHKWDLWAEENGYQAVKCAGCGLVYVPTLPSADEIDAATEAGLHRTEQGSLDVVGRYQRHKVKQYRAMVERVYGDSIGEQPIAWLDIGAGYGELVEAVSSLAHPASRILGIEPCQPKVDSAQTRGVNVVSEGLDEIEGRFDVVSLVHVFSHLANPVAFLTSLRRLLASEGEVLLVTGNGAEIGRDDYPGPLYLPDHLSFAGEMHLTRIFGLAGLAVIGIDRQAYSEPHNWLKNIARRLLGRPAVTIRPDSRFSILSVRARQRV